MFENVNTYPNYIIKYYNKKILVHNKCLWIKCGDFEGDRRGCEFTNLNEELFEKYLEGSNFKVLEYMITKDFRPDRTEKWLNAVIKK